jgi:hypothetical protein
MSEIKTCRHTRCGKPALQISVVDDHDSNAGVFRVRGYCSLDCLVCDIKHAEGDPTALNLIARFEIES